MQAGTGKTNPKENQNSPWLIIAAFFIIAASIPIFLFFYQGNQGSTIQGEIAIYPPFQKVPEGVPVSFSVYSTCGDFSFFEGGKKIAEGKSGQKFSFSLPAGTHLLEAKNPECSASATAIVVEKECEDGQVAPCEKDGCPGNKTCYGGIWGSCSLPPKKCVPGSKIGCSYDSCSFGYMTCNECGTGFGPCLIEGVPAANSLSCS